MSKTVIYTCITGGRDRPKHIKSPNDYRYVLFTDEPEVESKRWEVLPLAFQDQDPCRIARYHKHNPHKLFPDAEFSVWIDGTLAPVWDLSSIFKYVESKPIAAYTHPERRNTRTEAEACIRSSKDSPKRINAQMQRYKDAGFPDDLGLYCTPVLVRKHCPEMEKLQDAWWEEICNGSRRDQLSFTYCLWKTSVGCQVMQGSYQPGKNPYFYMTPHYPIDYIPLL